MNNKDPLYIIYFNHILVLIVLVFLVRSIGATPVKNQIYKWNPNFPKNKANIISMYVYKHSFINNLKPRLLTAILIQESSLRLDAQNYTSNDFGIGQIHHKTAKHFCPKIKKLLTDYDYSIGCAAKVLGDFKKRYSHKEKQWWTRYNSSNKIIRKRYKNLVVRHIWGRNE